MIYFLVFVVLVLAAARGQRLVVIDDIAHRFRKWIADTRYMPSKLASCYWCAGFWVSLFLCAYTLTAAATLHYLTWAEATISFLPLTFAVSYASSWLVDKEEN